MTGAGPDDDGVYRIRQTVANARPLNPPLAAAPADDDGPSHDFPEGYGQGGGDDGIEDPAFDFRAPVGLPVKPLGTFAGVYYYMDTLHQLRDLKAADHTKNNLAALFGMEIAFAYRAWATAQKNDNTKLRMDWERCGQVLMYECSRRGIWDMKGRLRGVGAWRGDADELIVHAGDGYAVRPIGADAEVDAGRPIAFHPPGGFGKYVYPAEPAQPRPAEEACDHRWGHDLLAVLRQWNFRREADPFLLLGWIGAAMLCGALNWRPAVWITGDKGTGKSTLQQLVERIFARGIVSVSDTTAAGIWQKVGHRAIPVAIDEMEADADNRRADAVVKLARQAASGGVVLRGGADHEGSEFTARSAFLFSSILPPPLQAQDRSRLAILELGRLDTSKPAPRHSRETLEGFGRMLRRRLWDRWPDVDECVDRYERRLREAGHTARAAMQFGTLLALADILLFDRLPDEGRLNDWAERMQPGQLSELDDEMADGNRCLDYLLTAAAPIIRGGERVNVVSLIQKAVGDPDQPMTDIDQQTANNQLQKIGVRITRPGHTGRPVLAVANNHRGLADIFRESKWSGRSDTNGNWIQPLRSIEGAKPSPSALSFDGFKARATLIPLDGLIATEKEDRDDQ